MPVPASDAPVPQYPASYLIQINDAQRLALMKLLAANVQQFQQPDPDCVDPVDSEYHPLYYWHSMLNELDPKDPDNRTMTHGFCL